MAEPATRSDDVMALVEAEERRFETAKVDRLIEQMMCESIGSHLYRTGSEHAPETVDAVCAVLDLWDSTDFKDPRTNEQLGWVVQGFLGVELVAASSRHHSRLFDEEGDPWPGTALAVAGDPESTVE